MGPGKLNSHEKRQRTDTSLEVIKMLELSDKDYKAVIIKVLKEVRVTTLEANVKESKQKTKI